MPTVQNKRGTAANLSAANPILLAGEIAFETDTGRFKLGNGTTAWNSLPYNDSAVGSANQVLYKNSSNVATGNANLTYDGTGILSASQFKATQSSGDEGGQIDLAKSVTNTTLSTGVSIDVYQNRLRFFETGGTNRGYYLDISAGGAGVGTKVLGESSPTIVGSLTLGTGGIIFPATATISANANTLDDYEEGTFTPTYTGSTGNPTVTYGVGTQIGNYVKIGRLVIYTIRISTTARTGGTGNVRISGLPFTVSGNNQANYSAATVSYKSGFTTTGPDGGYVDAGSTYIWLTVDNNTSHSFVPMANLTNGNTDLLITGVYETDG